MIHCSGTLKIIRECRAKHLVDRLNPQPLNLWPPRAEEWGEDNLIEFAKTCHGLPAFDAMTRFMAAAEAFAAGASQHDDMTLVVLRVLP